MTDSVEGQLAQLKARQDIHDVLARYCRGADRCDAALMKSCFHEDAWDDHGFFSGPAGAFAEAAAKNLAARYLSSAHHITNEYVEIDADQANSETYILCLSRMAKDGALFDVTFSARYLDRFERRNGQWKIVHRLLVNDGSRIDPVVQQETHFDQVRSGARAPDDPSCAFFRPSSERA